MIMFGLTIWPTIGWPRLATRVRTNASFADVADAYIKGSSALCRYQLVMAR
jgi:hypothetical protein